MEMLLQQVLYLITIKNNLSIKKRESNLLVEAMETFCISFSICDVNAKCQAKKKL